MHSRLAQVVAPSSCRFLVCHQLVRVDFQTAKREVHDQSKSAANQMCFLLIRLHFHQHHRLFRPYHYHSRLWCMVCKVTLQNRTPVRCFELSEGIQFHCCRNIRPLDSVLQSLHGLRYLLLHGCCHVTVRDVKLQIIMSFIVDDPYSNKSHNHII